jgi:hypothetical protein
MVVFLVTHPLDKDALMGVEPIMVNAVAINRQCIFQIGATTPSKYAKQTFTWPSDFCQ